MFYRQQQQQQQQHNVSQHCNAVQPVDTRYLLLYLQTNTKEQSTKEAQRKNRKQAAWEIRLSKLVCLTRKRKVVALHATKEGRGNGSRAALGTGRR